MAASKWRLSTERVTLQTLPCGSPLNLKQMHRLGHPKRVDVVYATTICNDTLRVKLFVTWFIQLVAKVERVKLFVTFLQVVAYSLVAGSESFSKTK